MQSVRLTVIAVFVFLLAGVTNGYAQLVDPRGSDDTIDIATWNMQQFPLDGTNTTTVVGLMTGDLELDVIGVQEITDEGALQTAASLAGGWSVQVGPEEAGGIRLGVMYRNASVDVTGEPYLIYGNQFTRNPFVVPMSITENETTIEFHLVVLHLKAFPQYYDTRIAELAALKAFIDDEMQDGDELNWVVVGDYNDELDDPDVTNIFLSFFADEDYEFLTMPLAGDSYQWSYPSENSLLDHIMVTASLLDDYGDDGVTETLRLDDEYDDYFEDVSDHRPVASYFPALSTPVREKPPKSLPGQPEITLWPVPSNSSVTVSYNLAVPQGVLTVHDLLGRELARQTLRSSSGRAVWEAQDVPSGVYLVRVQDLRGHTVQGRAVLVK